MAQHRTGSKRASKGPDGNTSKREVVFTLAHATKALPYVRRIVSDVVTAHESAVVEQGALQSTNPGSDRAIHQSRFAGAVERLNTLGEELKAVGVEVKDQATGLIEFPTLHKRQPAVLVWQHGQDKIGYARVVSSGVRVPVESLDEAE